MSGPVAVNGVVLLAAPSGEYDKRLVLLTKERGKITAFARGARKSTSSLLAAANPFVFGTFYVYEGRTAYSLYQAEIHHHFTDLAREIPGVYYGFYFLEFADYYGREGVDASAMVNLLFVALKSLGNPRIPNELVRYVFELKLMVLNGEYPQVFECTACKKKENLEYFSDSFCGVLCSSCRQKAQDGKKISPTLLYTMQYIISAPLDRLYTFTVTGEVLAELAALMKAYVKNHTDKRFKSLEILEMMC
ncbi:MAG: DNA repair protein RecO [Ruminococcus sp.]|jgi:DNA repair protein RecO (recombination protein O)